jgi:hypothetical protein
MIAEAARRLVTSRDNWLNPVELVREVPEVAAGLPTRLVPISPAAAEQLRSRTLTNLYNERPTWLVSAHRALDLAVAAAYGISADLADDDLLGFLLDRNHRLFAAFS